MMSTGALAGAMCVVGLGSSPAHADHVDPVDLGSVKSFGVLSPAAVGNAANTAGKPPTTIRGDLGAGGAITGFAPGWGVVTGTTYEGAPAISTQMADLNDAFDDARARPAGTPLAANLSGLVLGPGVHTTAAAVDTTASTSLTLDGQDHPDAVFIFQIGGALSLGANTEMILTGGARAENVFWAVTGAGGIGADTTFVGTLIAGTAVSSGDGSTINGRLTSLTGAVTMSATQLYSGPPTVSIYGNVAAQPAATATTTDSTPLITGTTSSRAPMTVEITVDGGTTSVSPAADGAWSYQAPLLINGEHIITATSTDGAGNVGSFVQTLTVDTTPPAVGIDGGPTRTTNTVTPRISGTTDIAAEQPVTITLTNTTLTRSTLVQQDATWNISPNGLTAGTWTIVARVLDPAGNVSTATQALLIDATAPAVSITSNALTNDATPFISGTTESGASVAVSVDGVFVPGVIVTGASWAAQTTVALATGTHHVSVTSTDVAGNTTAPAVTQTLTVDLVLPLIGINPGATDWTNDRTPTIVGTTDVAPGSGVIVSVSIDGGAELSAVVQADGWNVTPSSLLAVGAHTIVARIVDPAGNVGTFTQTLTIDIADPSVDVDGGPSRNTTDATPTISGSSPDAAAGSEVVVAINGQTLRTTMRDDGSFSVTAGVIPNGTHFVFVTVTDAAGNIGTENQALTVNAIPPVVVYDNGPSASTNDPTPLISGTTDAGAGSVVVVGVAAQTLNATVQPGGSWNVTAAAIGNGVVTVATQITDGSGNIGSATQTLIIDATTPTSIVFNGGATAATNDATPTISGTTDAADGRVLTVTVAGQTMTVAAALGAWSVNASQITDGTYVVSVSVSAVGGNPGSASQSLTIDTVDPSVAPTPVETTDTTPSITGSGATPGSTVSVTVAGQTITTVVGDDGTWSVTPPDPLPAGVHAATITITDPAGNTGTGSRTVTVVAQPGTPTGSEADEYTSVGPKRVFDTRAGQSPNALRAVAERQVSGGYELQVRMTDLVGYVPAGGVGAVSLNVTSTESTAAGFITVSACGSRELVSSVNFAAGKTVANAVIAPVSASGDVCFYANTPTDIIVDINGWFAAGAAFNAVGPKRVFDTRPDDSPDALRTVPKAKLATNTMMEVRVTDLAGHVPADGVGSVSLNVVVTNPEAPGFITVYSCGTRAQVSSVNFAAGQTVANAVIAPVSANGTVCFYTLAAADLIVDINGWLAAGSSFHGIDPARVLDTRAGESPNAIRSVPKAAIGGGNVLQVQVTDMPGVVPATSVAAVSLNVTATNTAGAGFLTVFDCGTMEEVSSLNFGAGATVANAVLAPVSASGSICVFSNQRTDVIVDINGWVGTGEAG